MAKNSIFTRDWRKISEFSFLLHKFTRILLISAYGPKSKVFSWSILANLLNKKISDHFIKHKPLISEEWVMYFMIFRCLSTVWKSAWAWFFQLILNSPPLHVSQKKKELELVYELSRNFMSFFLLRLQIWIRYCLTISKFLLCFWLQNPIALLHPQKASNSKYGDTVHISLGQHPWFNVRLSSSGVWFKTW